MLKIKTFLLTVTTFSLFVFYGCSNHKPIDRFALISRHNIEIKEFDSLNSLSVGNGKFAFTVDITGLQTLPGYYSKGIPPGTMADWAWHSEVNKEGYSLEQVYRTYNIHGRETDYVHRYSNPRDTLRYRASEWLRENPHKIHLGMIGLDFDGENESQIKDSIKEPLQKLNLWKGEIESGFTVKGRRVSVKTVCHPELDMVSSVITSALLSDNKLRIKIHFPLGVSGQTAYDFSQPDKHTTEIVSESDTTVLFRRQQDEDTYYVKLYKPRSVMVKGGEKHLFYLEAQPGDTLLEFSCLFSKSMPASAIPGFSETEKASAFFWKDFWSTGGAVDFSECTDPRAPELERRVILSRYLTRIQCAGDYPPAETGLTYNTWYGKFHLEMHWWHGVHFALWQKESVLENQMRYYEKIYDRALATARHQGYEGVRWPKMTDPDGRESPSNVGTYLIWQQPHFIYFAEMLYHSANDKKEVLLKYKDLLFATADFMSSYAWYDTALKRYVLGPVLISAQESLKPETTINPTFELVYWYWGLKTAQEWRRRLGMKPSPKYADVLKKLSPLPVKEGLYLCSEDTRDTWQNPRYKSDHPVIAGIAGMIPETGMVDKNILRNTLDTIQKVWNWQTCWGWDFPMLAMSAAAVGRSEQAVDFLLMDAPKNRYLPNGHNWQDATRLMIYLPGNGGLLTAVAKMCTSDTFPHNGKWNVKWEGLSRY